MCSCLCKLLSLLLISPLSLRSSNYKRQLFCYSVQIVVWPSTFQNFLLIRVNIYDGILIQANFCICWPSLLGLCLSFGVCPKTPTYKWGHPCHLQRHLLHCNTLTQTQDLVLTFDSRVKTILNHLDLFFAFDTVDYHIILHCTENCVGIKDTPALFSHFLCCSGRILLLCSSSNLCCSILGPLFSRHLQSKSIFRLV